MVNAAKGLTEGASLSTWITSQGKLYNDIMMIRQIMYLAMILVMAVACFNIISNLIMTVTEKKREIAILLTMGLKRSQIIKSFCLLGLISGSIGTAIGFFYRYCLFCTADTFYRIFKKQLWYSAFK